MSTNDAIYIHRAQRVDGVPVRTLLRLRVVNDVVVLLDELGENLTPLPAHFLSNLPGDLLKVSHGVGMKSGEGRWEGGGKSSGGVPYFLWELRGFNSGCSAIA